MARKNTLVNEDKVTRAKEIFALVAGTVAPRNQTEVDRKVLWERHLIAGSIGLEDEEVAIEFIYEKLGGLVRSPEEQAKAERRKVEIKKSKKVEPIKVR
jgi:hypothetical protein